jgi:citrate lyase subunit beta / citryl-CoA lyase
VTAPPLRSLLFVPGSRPDRFDKALAAGASRVILDLADAAAPGDKDAAREAVLRFVQPGHSVIVRINAADTPWFAHDVELCRRDGLAGIMLPKAERADTVATLMDAGARSVLALIESAAGFAAMGSIAAAPGVAHLVFGSIDFQADLGMRDAPEDDLAAFRAALVLASRLAGIGAPIDGVTVQLDDEARLGEDVARARRLGFGGKLCIHPRQVALVNRLFAPSAQEQAWARRVIAATKGGGGGAVNVDGRMVDRPVVLRAEAILRESQDGA